jgi:phosphatidylinositol alpha-1,6-mannosyltransferase
MASVLFVSKPVAPPWNDSNKNLVRAIATAMNRYSPTVLTPRGQTLAHVRSEAIYDAAGEFAPALASNLRVLRRLIAGKRTDIWHFFFGPNPRTLHAGRVARLLRATPCVHTIASAPDNLERVATALFADSVVVLSQHTQSRMNAVGVECSVIRPAIEPLDVDRARISQAIEKHGLRVPYVLYPGDLEFGNGARLFVECAARAKDLRWVIASRAKTESAKSAALALKRHALAIGAEINWLGEIEDIHAVVAGAGAVVLVTDTLHAKMDWPLVILEALMCGVGCVVSDRGSMRELAASGGCVHVAPTDSTAILAGVRELLANYPAERAARARKWVVDTCAPSTVAKQYEAIYDTLLSRRNVRANRIIDHG